MTRKISIGRTVMAQATPTQVKPPEPPRAIEVHAMPQINSIMSDAYAVLGLELRYYANQKRKFPDSPLDKDEAMIVASHIRALALLATEEREARKVDDMMSKLTDAQLVKLGVAAVKALKDGES